MAFGAWTRRRYDYETVRPNKGRAGRHTGRGAKVGTPIHTSAPKDGRPFMCQSFRNKTGKLSMVCEVEPIVCMSRSEFLSRKANGGELPKKRGR